MGVDHETLSVADLKLDVANPRHDPAKSQREAIAALLSQEGAKLARLAEDIALNGLSPVDEFLVLKEAGPSYTVVEGNRRLASVKLLANPELTNITKYQARFRSLKKKMSAPIHEVRCAIVTSRDEAKHWQLLRHHGQSEGRGVVPWESAASTRFFSRRGTHTEKALGVLDAIETAFGANKKLLEDARDVRKNRPTTFGRLVSDPFVRGKLGLEIAPGVEAHYPSELLESALGKILSDLATGRVTVSDLKSAKQRRDYIIGAGDSGVGDHLPAETAYEPEARPLVPAGSPRPPAPSPKPKPAPKPARTGTKALFDGVQLTNLGSRISEVLSELQRLDVDTFPNASAALLRVVVELAVTEVHVRKGWPTGPHIKLRDMVKKCVGELDPTGKAPKYQWVRTGLNDGTSLFAVATIHAYLHNAHFNPTPSELRSTSSNLSAFLADLDTLG
jgi:hypothetical protein